MARNEPPDRGRGMTRRAQKGFAAAAATAVLVLGMQAAPAAAQSVERVGDYNAWSTYTTTEDGNKVCFIASSPTKSEGQYTRRGNAFAIGTLRPADNRDPEVSFIAGYTYQPESTVEVVLDDQHTFALFTQDDAAWLPNDAQADRQLIERMLAGLAMVRRGTSSRGPLPADTSSLRGFTAAHGARQQACS